MSGIVWKRSGGALLIVLFLSLLLLATVFPLVLLFLPILFYHPPQGQTVLPLAATWPARPLLPEAFSGRGPPPAL